MMLARMLLITGSLVLAAGVLCGVPFYLDIVFERPPEKVRAWRVAHATLISDGLFMLVVAILLPDLILGAPSRLVLAWSLVLSGWGFAFALAGGAWAGRRGLVPTPIGVETVFFLGHAVGAAGALVGILLLVAGLFR